MLLVDFNARLADFKTWVEFMEDGLDFDTDTTVEARILSDDCTTTSTSTSTTTSTSTSTSTSSTTTTSTTSELTTTTTTTEEITIINIDCPDPTWYTGGTVMPTRHVVTLGSTIGKVEMTFNIHPIPDRMIMWFDGNVVIDTGYRGSDRYDIGGDLRNTFILGLSGKTDPVAPYTYPLSAGDIIAYDAAGYNVNQPIRSDGYPAINPDYNSEVVVQSSLNILASTVVSVIQPLKEIPIITS